MKPHSAGKESPEHKAALDHVMEEMKKVNANVNNLSSMEATKAKLVNIPAAITNHKDLKDFKKPLPT